MEEKLLRLTALQEIVYFVNGEREGLNYKAFKQLKLYFLDLSPNKTVLENDFGSRFDYTLAFLIKHNNINIMSIVLNDIIIENEDLIKDLTEILNKDTQGNFQYVLKKNDDGSYDLVKTDKKDIPKWSLSTQRNNEELVYIKFDEHSRDITLNGIVWLSQPNFSSENYLVFQYLYDNPNKKVSKDEILQNAMNGENLKKTSHEILRDLGFTGTLREIFFTTSKEYIIFHKERNRNEIEKLLPIKIGKDKEK